MISPQAREAYELPPYHVLAVGRYRMVCVRRMTALLCALGTQLRIERERSRYAFKLAPCAAWGTTEGTCIFA